MRLKKFENFDQDMPMSDPYTHEEDLIEEPVEGDNNREHGFYWVEFNGKMTIAEWVHDPDGADFWLPAGEEFNPDEEEITVIQYIEPPLNNTEEVTVE